MKLSYFFISVFSLAFLVGVVRAEEELSGFLVTPEQLEFTSFSDQIFPETLPVDLVCVGKKVEFTRTIGGEEHTFICDFDCSNTNFEWQVISGKSWLHFSPTRGEDKELSQLQAWVNLSQLFLASTEDCNGTPCFRSNVTFRFTYHLPCQEYYNVCETNPETGKEECQLSVSSAWVVVHEELPLENFATVYYNPLNWGDFEVAPEVLYFSGKISGENPPSFDPLKISVKSGLKGWTYSSPASWLSLSKTGDAWEGELEVTPSNLSLPGHYQSFVTIKDLQTGQEKKVNIILDLWPEEEQSIPYIIDLPSSGRAYALLEIVPSQWFSLQVNFADPGELNNIYIVATHSALPDYIFAYTEKLGEPLFEVASYQGNPVPEIDNLFYAAETPSKLTIGPLRLLYLPGTGFIYIKRGPSWEEAETLLTIQLHIHSIAGQWQVTDEFNGQEYQHSAPLIISEGLEGLSASWGDYHPQISYGDGINSLYEINFVYLGVYYRYVINYLEAGIFSGLWSYSLDGIHYSDPQPFRATKIDTFSKGES